jgi:DNA repair exonuclease SbcCD nuclease subunit
MKVAIITDTHYGARKGSKVFHDYFEQFYKNVFFPTLEEHGIDTVIHMGDAFDSRKSIDYTSLEWAKRVVFDPLSSYDVHMIVGNHDTYYKNTNNLNSPELLLSSYSNIKTYSSPTEVNIGGLDILFLPWINDDNEEISLKYIKNSSCKCAMGHLELNGFRVNSQIVMDHGMEGKLFAKFSRVYSGHYHTRSNDGKIFYLGNPYEMFWNDVNDSRGFTIFDTDTLEHVHVNNPHRLFYVLNYDDRNDSSFKTLHFDTKKYENKIVKVVVKSKTNPKQYDKFLDKLYASNPFEVKIVENFEIAQDSGDTEIESEDTLSVLDRYIHESEVNLNKTIVQKLIRDIYQEACEIC